MDEPKRQNADSSGSHPLIQQLRDWPIPPEDAPSKLAFWREVESQTDRGAAVITAAYLEWQVREAIRMRLPQWGSQGDHLFGTDKRGGELGFTDQCRMAYCLALVGPIGFNDLGRVGRIRNKFAHSAVVTSFDDPVVRDLCDELGTPSVVEGWRVRSSIHSDTDEPMNRRTRYILTAATLAQCAGWNALKYPKVDLPSEFANWIY